MISDAIGTGLKGIISWIVRALARSRINPNVLTFTGLLINIGCGVLYAYGHFFRGRVAADTGRACRHVGRQGGAASRGA